jgi:ATP-dependent RNA helicase RhlE
MGFRPQVDRILEQIPLNRQTMLFSATLDGPVADLARTYTVSAARFRTGAQVTSGAGDVGHEFVPVTARDKLERLADQLRRERKLALVFVRTKHGADKLARKLGRDHDVHAAVMHGNMSQNARERSLQRFESGRVSTLIATDVAARGLDVDEITHVINFDVPDDRDTYVHRTGRTGRAGASGVAASFVLPDQHHEMQKIATDLGLHTEYHADRNGAGDGVQPRTRGGGGRGGNVNGGGRGKRNGRRSANGGGPRTYSARPPRNRRRRSRARAA